jgi:DNA repair photolyase
MQVRTIKTDRILNIITKKDTLFHGLYTVDPYQNCEFGCIYCDSSYNKEVFVKTNAAEILNEKLKSLEKGRIIIGSVHDPYQKIEEKHLLTREILKTIQKHDFSCHILTKSELVLRDINILKKINDCIVTISLTSMDESISKIFEKDVVSPLKRMQIVQKLKESNINAGLGLIPIIPYIVDEQIDKIVEHAKKYNANYLLFKHLEIKGDQKDIFFEIIKKYYPQHYQKFIRLYKDSFLPDEKYQSYITKKIKDICLEKEIKNTIF